MSDRLLVLGHRGLVGSAICRQMQGERLITIDPPILDHGEKPTLDLRVQADVAAFFRREKPTHVYLAAARVGGIEANRMFPADFIRDNLQIQTNVVDASHRAGAKLLFLGSSCIYPREAPQPITESALGTGPLELTNEAYAWGKLAGIAMVKAYRKQYGFRGICLMPTNLYGPHDNFDAASSHLVPALIRKMHEAKVRGAERVLVWGTGTPRRELLHVDDLARAAVHLMRTYEGDDIVNIGTSEDLSVREIAELIADVVGYRGRLGFDASRPDGTPRKVLDVSRARALGWTAEIPLRRGLEQTYAWYLENAR